MTNSVCCRHGKCVYLKCILYKFFTCNIYNVSFFSANLTVRHLVYMLGTTMEIRATRPFREFFLSLVTSMVALIFICLHPLPTQKKHHTL